MRIYDGPMPDPAPRSQPPVRGTAASRTHRAAGADFLQLDPAVAPVRGLTDWLAAELRSAIGDGRLPAGGSLPATRALAGDLGVSRGIVVEAYQRLKDEGLIGAGRGAGTRVLAGGVPPRPVGAVADAPPGGDPLASTAGAGAWPDWAGAGARSDPAGLDARSGAAGRDGLIRPPLSWQLRAEIDLSPGVPDLSAFPRAAWLRAERAVLAGATTADLGYGDPRGSGPLRTELAGWLWRTRGVRAAPEEIMIVSGVAQAMALLALELKAGPATRIGVEDPGSLGARDELSYWGLEPVQVPVDDQGLVVSELAASGACAALLTPAHQFPTGVVLGPERRRELLAWPGLAPVAW